jgi:hypothetical protein
VTRAIPEQVTSLEELDALCEQLARLRRSKAVVQIVFLVSLVPLLVSGYWAWSNPAPFGVSPALTVFCVVAMFFGSALVRIPGRWKTVRRFCRRLAPAIKAGVPHLQAGSPRAGEALGRSVVLEASDTLMHVSRREGPGALRLSRIGLLLGAVVAASLFIAGQALYGPLLTGLLGTTHVGALKVFYLLPLAAVVLPLAAVQPVALQWYVSLRSGTITVERIRWLVIREVIDIPADVVSGVSVRGNSVWIEWCRGAQELVRIPAMAPIDGISADQAKQLSDRVIGLRGARIAQEISKLLGLQKEPEYTSGAGILGNWARARRSAIKRGYDHGRP